MYKITRAADRYHFENDWLSTYWHFSFDHYYDPDNLDFGPLRVFNDDVIQPGKGFPAHGHREMEIVTYVLKGSLEHQDSSGGKGIIGPGEVQRMSAGTGIRHSEFNASQDEPVHLLQIWITPGVSGLKPGYEQKKPPVEESRGVLLPIVSGRNDGAALKIHQDTVFYVSKLQAGDEVEFKTTAERRAYAFVMEGKLSLGEHDLQAGDTARISAEPSVVIRAGGRSELLLIDLP